jgi:hypothetical protein
MWASFSEPRHRFDPKSGRFRVRYAGDSQRSAMRERFDGEDRVVSAGQLGLHLAELSGAIRVLDLRLERNLDALGLDDQISTSRSPQVWATSHWLADRIYDWYGEACAGIVYRSRTTPQRSANLAFFGHAPLRAISLGRLRTRTELLTACVLSDGFVIDGDW